MMPVENEIVLASCALDPVGTEAYATVSPNGIPDRVDSGVL
jgi:hypothetical protein